MTDTGTTNQVYCMSDYCIRIFVVVQLLTALLKYFDFSISKEKNISQCYFWSIKLTSLLVASMPAQS